LALLIGREKIRGVGNSLPCPWRAEEKFRK